VSTSTAPSVRCPACTAYVRAGSEWCTLCYADLRPKPVSPPEPPPTTAPAVRTDDAAEVGSAEHVESLQDVASRVSDVPAPATSKPRGKHAKQAADAAVFGQPTQVVTVSEIEALADQMLAELAASEGTNPLGGLSAATDSKGKRVALMIGGGVAAMCVLFALMFLAGSFV
jgi:hypothetical protein